MITGPDSLSGFEENFASHRESFRALNAEYIRLIGEWVESLSKTNRMGLSTEHAERIGSLSRKEAERLASLDFPLIAHRQLDSKNWATVGEQERAEWRTIATAAFISIGNLIRTHHESARLVLGVSCSCETALGDGPLATLGDKLGAESKLQVRLSETALGGLLDALDGNDQLWTFAKRQAMASLYTPLMCDCTRNG